MLSKLSPLYLRETPTISSSSVQSGVRSEGQVDESIEPTAVYCNFRTRFSIAGEGIIGHGFSAANGRQGESSVDAGNESAQAQSNLEQPTPERIERIGAS